MLDMSRAGRSTLLGNVGLVLLAVLVGAFAVASVIHTRPDVSEKVAAAPPLPPPPPPAPVVLVVGDSFVGGSEMNSGPTWPTLMRETHDWVILPEAEGGTGYISGNDRQGSFPERAASMRSYLPDVLVVAGGINDAGKYPTQEIANAARKTLDALEKRYPEATLVLLSPFANDFVGSPTVELTEALKSLARSRGAAFLDVSRLLEGRGDLIGSDQVHPTDAGHAYLASMIGPRLAPIIARACRSSGCGSAA